MSNFTKYGGTSGNRSFAEPFNKDSGALVIRQKSSLESEMVSGCIHTIIDKENAMGRLKESFSQSDITREEKLQDVTTVCIRSFIGQACPSWAWISQWAYNFLFSQTLRIFTNTISPPSLTGASKRLVEDFLEGWAR